MPLKAVKLGSLSTLSHYFQDEMGGYTKQVVVFGISFIDSKVWMWEVSRSFMR